MSKCSISVRESTRACELCIWKYIDIAISNTVTRAAQITYGKSKFVLSIVESEILFTVESLRRKIFPSLTLSPSLEHFQWRQFG